MMSADCRERSFDVNVHYSPQPLTLTKAVNLIDFSLELEPSPF